jgi:ribosomal protein L16 Arg81 hydroxylase
LDADEFVYLNAPVNMLGKELQKDVPTNFLPDRWKPAMVNTWMGSAGSIAPLHHDPFDNFFIQVYGRKRFLLFPPADHRNLYVYPKTHARNRQSQVDLRAEIPDLPNNPFAHALNATGLEILLNPGDVMYLPPFWFHQVESVDDTISLNTWYNSPLVVRFTFHP